MEGRQEQGYGLRGAVLKERQEGQKKGRRRKRRSTGGEERVKGCGLSPGGSPSHPPFPPLHLPPSTQPLPGCLSLHNGCFSAEISRYWIPSLEFCSPTMSRQRSMLQGRHTLQVKSWKTIPSFITIKKGEKVPPHTPLFSITHFPPHFYPASKPEEGCQTQSSFTRPLWFVGFFGWLGRDIKISLGK